MLWRNVGPAYRHQSQPNQRGRGRGQAPTPSPLYAPLINGLPVAMQGDPFSSRILRPFFRFPRRVLKAVRCAWGAHPRPGTKNAPAPHRKQKTRMVFLWGKVFYSSKRSLSPFLSFFLDSCLLSWGTWEGILENLKGGGGEAGKRALSSPHSVFRNRSVVARAAKGW